jgi:type II restriction/modification system DNA methylase subunit YeeA
MQINLHDRYIATPKVSKHRLFVWLSKSILPDNLIVSIARSDDASFGILHSRIHEVWSLKKAAYIGAGNDPTYTPTSTFETFPLPEGLTPNVMAADYALDRHAVTIAAVAARLNEHRENWLNPPDLIVRVPEVVPGYLDRLLPRDDACAKQLKQRTLTNLYNQRPAWLDNLHRELDEAVAAAYGWPADLPDEEILKRLLALNLERART